MFIDPSVSSTSVLNLDAAISGVLLEHELSESQPSISISAWVKLDRYTSVTPTIYAQIKTDNNTWDEGYLEITDVLSPDIWYKIAMSYDNATGIFTIYINDEIAATTTLSGDLDISAFTPQLGFTDLDHCEYSIKELIFYDSVQTLAELEATSNLLKEPTEDMISVWLFNEGTGTVTYDLVDSYEGTLINCTWGTLETIGIYPKITRVLNSSSTQIFVQNDDIFEIGDTIYILNPTDTSTVNTNTVSAISSNIITLGSSLDIVDTNLIAIKDYCIAINPELNIDDITYSFNLFNYYNTSNPEIFLAIKSDITKTVTITISNIKYKMNELLTKEVTDDFSIFRYELLDGGMLQPYYKEANIFFDISTKIDANALFIEEFSGMALFNDYTFTTIKLETWINIQEAEATSVYLFGQLETTLTSFEDSYLESITPLSLNTWYHIALTYGVDGYMRLYLNGEEDSSILLDGDINNNKNIVLGIAGTSDYTAIYDEIKLWSNGDPVENIYTKLYGTEEDLLGYYELDTGSGTILEDSSINENDGFIIGSEYSWEASLIDFTYPFDNYYTKALYKNKLLRDRYVFKPKDFSSYEYIKTYNDITRLRMYPDLYETRIDELSMYEYDVTTITDIESFFYNNIELYKINYATENDIKLITINIDNIEYRVTLAGINIDDTISKYADKLLAFVFDTGLIYIYIPPYFKYRLDEVTIYEV